jgi:micrococcal nuclease
VKGTDPNWTGGAWVRPTPAPKPPRKRRNIFYSPLAWSTLIAGLLVILFAIVAAAPPSTFDQRPAPKPAPEVEAPAKVAPAPVPAPKPKPAPKAKPAPAPTTTTMEPGWEQDYDRGQVFLSLENRGFQVSNVHELQSNRSWEFLLAGQLATYYAFANQQQLDRWMAATSSSDQVVIYNPTSLYAIKLPADAMKLAVKIANTMNAEDWDDLHIKARAPKPAPRPKPKPVQAPAPKPKPAPTTTTTIPMPKPKPAPAPVPEPKPKPAPVPEGKVTRVVDGDTIKAIVNGKEEGIRLIGIETPETVDPNEPVQCYGPEASAEAARLLAGKRVTLEADPSQDGRDRYGRLLRYVFVNHVNFNQHMIAEGFAHELTYAGPYKYQADFKAAERAARKDGKGLWSACKVEAAPKPAPVPAPSPSQLLQDKDCKDFATQEEAQAYFDQNGGSTTNNVDRLDGNDRDGIVCESLKAA